MRYLIRNMEGVVVVAARAVAAEVMEEVGVQAEPVAPEEPVVVKVVPAVAQVRVQAAEKAGLVVVAARPQHRWARPMGATTQIR